MSTVKEILKKSYFSQFEDEGARKEASKADFNDIDKAFDDVLDNIKKGTDYEEKETPSKLEAYRLLNKFFWKVFGVNLIYSKNKLNVAIDSYNQAQAAEQGTQLVKEYLFRKEDNPPEEQVGNLVNPNQIINPISDSDERRTIYYFVNNIDEFIDEIFDKNKDIILYFLNKTSSSAPSQTPTGGSKTPPWAGSYEIPDMVSKHAIILKAIFSKILNRKLEIKTEAEFERIKDEFKGPIKANKEQLTIEQIIFLMRTYFLSYLPLSKKIEDAAKAEENKGTAKEDEDSDTATGGTRSGGTRPSGPTVASTYNIKKAPKDGWIGGYQNNLKRFYDANQATKDISKKYQPGKLTDGRYGFRTHYVTIKAAENIISQLDKFLNPKAAAKPASAAAAAPATTTTNERRIRQLSKLLEIKLVGAELNLFNEQDNSASEAEKKKKLQDLLTELSQIKQRLETAHNKDSIPEADTSVQGKDLARFNEILSILSWNNAGEIDFNKVYEKMQPSRGPAGTTSGKQKGEVVKRPSETSCFYAIDRTISGVTDLSPTKIWASVGADWVEWYKEALVLLKHEAAVAQPQFYYLSGEQSKYLGVVETMNKNVALNINLTCVSVYMTKFLLNLQGNMDAAQNLAKNGKGDADTYSHFIGPNGKTFKNSRADKLAAVLIEVLKAIPKLRKSQNQNAQVTGDKGLATTQNQAKTQDKAAAIAAKPSKAAAPAAGAAAPAATAPTAKALANTFRNYVSGVGASTDPAQRAKRAETIIKLMGGDGKTREAYLKKYPQTAEVLDQSLKILLQDTTFMGYLRQARPDTQIGSRASAATQKESIKEKREKLLHEAIFKKLVR